MDELRLALRRLIKRPAATVASIATLACAIGAAAVTWSTLSALIVHPLSVRDADRLVVVGTLETDTPRPGGLRTSFIYPVYQRVRESAAFSQVAAEWKGGETILVGSGGTPVPTVVGFATYDFFDVLGVPIALGRGLAETDDRRGAGPVAVLSERYWRRHLNADPGVVGRTLTIGGKQASIIGVLPRGFRGLDLSLSVEIYLAFHTIADVGSGMVNFFAETGHASSPTSGTLIVGRLHPGDSQETAASRLALAAAGPGRGQIPDRVVTIDVNTAAVPAAARAGMVGFAGLLASTVGLLLLIGCATVSLLLLIRTEARTDEFAMCMALGASRARLARGVIWEGALLAMAGAALSVPVSAWLFSLLRAFRLPGGVDIELLELTIDRTVAGSIAAAAILTVILVAAIAGAFGFRGDVANALHSRGGTTGRGSRRATRAVLVSGQVAVALALLAGAGLFARSLSAGLSLNSGADMARIVSGSISLEPSAYPAARADEFFRSLDAALERHPGISSAATSAYQGGMSPPGQIIIDGLPRQFPSTVSYLAVDDDYFKTMRMQLRAGRVFGREDRAGAPLVAIVTESYGRLLGEGGSPLGRKIRQSWSRRGQPPDEMVVVGVVSDMITSVAVMEPLRMYLPASQVPATPRRTLVVRSLGTADEARRDILAAVRQLEPEATVSRVMSLTEQIGQQMGPQRLGATVLSALGGIAVLLTLLGTYVLADSVATLRMREMGIRAALGATRRQLGCIVLAETGRLIGFGLLAGLLLAWLGAGTIRAFLFQIEPLDPLTLVAVAGLILLLTLSVSLRAAFRVGRVDLGQVLRSQ